HLNLLAEVLAGDVDPPLRGIASRAPPVDAALQHGDPPKPHPLESGRGEGGAAAVVVAPDHLGARERHEARHAVLELATRHEARPGNVRVVVLARLAHVDEGAGALRVEQGFESGRGHLLWHVWFGSSAMEWGRPQRGDGGPASDADFTLARRRRPVTPRRRPPPRARPPRPLGRPPPPACGA